MDIDAFTYVSSVQGVQNVPLKTLGQTRKEVKTRRSFFEWRNAYYAEISCNSVYTQTA